MLDSGEEDQETYLGHVTKKSNECMSKSNV